MQVKINFDRIKNILAIATLVCSVIAIVWVGVINHYVEAERTQLKIKNLKRIVENNKIVDDARHKTIEKILNQVTIGFKPLENSVNSLNISIKELNKKIDQAIKGFNEMEDSFDLLNQELQEYISILIDKGIK